MHLQGSGSDGIRGLKINENIEIVNNIIEDIGGSYLNITEEERYGNAISFFETEVKNLKIHKNIIRNVYDVAFTIQGNIGSGRNVTVTKNIFCLNSQDSEIWESHGATGVYNYVFEDNISFLQGRGWGYFARNDKKCASHILFWGYNFDNVVEKTDMYFNHNYVYNPKRIYYVTTDKNTYLLFQKEECIRSDFNYYYLSNDSLVYRDNYDFTTRNNFIQDFNKDKNSTFILLDEVDPDIVDKATNSLDYKELRKIFVDDVDDEDDEEKNNSHTLLITLVVIFIIILLLVGGIIIIKYIKKRKNKPLMDNLTDFPLVSK